jgi:hypothetical protein
MLQHFRIQARQSVSRAGSRKTTTGRSLGRSDFRRLREINISPRSVSYKLATAGEGRKESSRIGFRAFLIFQASNRQDASPIALTKCIFQACAFETGSSVGINKTIQHQGRVSVHHKASRDRPLKTIRYEDYNSQRTHSPKGIDLWKNLYR